MNVPAPRLGQGLAVDLLNTVWADRAGTHDELAGPGSASAWAGLRLTAPQTRELRDLRDAARDLAAELTADPRAVAAGHERRADSAVALLNATSARAPSWPVLVDGRVERASGAGPADGHLGGLAAELVELLAAGSGLQACLAPGCVLYFLKDHPRRAWCSTSCGNRERAARHYARRRTARST